MTEIIMALTLTMLSIFMGFMIIVMIIQSKAKRRKEKILYDIQTLRMLETGGKFDVFGKAKEIDAETAKRFKSHNSV